MATLSAAFRSARIHSVQHMEACEKVRLGWGEVAITEMVTSRVARATTLVPFTQRAESVSGADWVWWWIDATSAYGMLVQAKRVTISGDKWHFHFDYPRRTGTQRAKLMTTAASLSLTPVYALYLGTPRYRNGQSCSKEHRTGRCISCIKRSVSLMPAVLGEEARVHNAATTYERSVPLEDVWMPEAARALLIPTTQKKLAPELSEFLMTRQTGVRAVTRAMIDRVLTIRAGQFSAVSAPSDALLGDDHDRLGSIFPKLPADTGHWGIPYFENVLDPLKHAPPGYVLELEAGGADADELASLMPESVAGLVIVRVSQDGTKEA